MSALGSTADIRSVSHLSAMAGAHEKDPRLTLVGASLHQTGKAAAIRKTFDPFTVQDGVDAVQTKVHKAFGSCRELVKLYRQHRVQLERLRVPQVTSQMP